MSAPDFSATYRYTGALDDLAPSITNSTGYFGGSFDPHNDEFPLYCYLNTYNKQPTHFNSGPASGTLCSDTITSQPNLQRKICKLGQGSAVPSCATPPYPALDTSGSGADSLNCEFIPTFPESL